MTLNYSKIKEFFYNWGELELNADGEVITPCLVMVSGGSDSMALLTLLSSGELGRFKNYEVLHVNHCLRDESKEDADFVEEFCQGRGIPCTVEAVDVLGYIEETGKNLEEAARDLRYTLAEHYVKEMENRHNRTGRILTAHTADENAETLFMRLLYGAGMSGLSGIPVRNGRILRPLLENSKEELKEYLKNNSVDWREDVTNLDTTRDRAWVRHELLPLLKERKDGVISSITATQNILREEDDFLKDLTSMNTSVLEKEPEKYVYFSLDRLQKNSAVLARRDVYMNIVENFHASKRITSDHIREIMGLIRDNKKELDLPGELHAFCEGGLLKIIPIEEWKKLFLRDIFIEDFSPEEESILYLKEGILSSRIYPYSKELVFSPHNEIAYLDYDKLNNLIITEMNPGDCFKPFGMKNTKKVAKFLKDNKVPRSKRNRIMLLKDNDAVVWVIGHRIAEDYKVDSSTQTVLELHFEAK